ncbi:MAG: hypothetical protein ACR65R_05890 [Methylomicrobium sp.]
MNTAVRPFEIMLTPFRFQRRINRWVIDKRRLKKNGIMTKIVTALSL